jgi:predicted nucleic acid-binding Zn ribbon protein
MSAAVCSKPKSTDYAWCSSRCCWRLARRHTRATSNRANLRVLPWVLLSGGVCSALAIIRTSIAGPDPRRLPRTPRFEDHRLHRPNRLFPADDVRGVATHDGSDRRLRRAVG